MTTPDLDYLVRLARRDRPPSATLLVMARRLQVPLAVAPVTAVVVPSSAFAAFMAKLGVSRSWLLGWGAGSAIAVSGAVATLSMGTSRPAPNEMPTAVARSTMNAPLPVRPSSMPSAPQPEARALPSSVERPRPRDVQTPWDEPQLIERARKALGSDPKRALALTQEYQRRFPRGTLTVEREVIAVEALAQLGQVEAARRRALAFEAAHPSSIHLPRVRALLARLNTPP